MQAYSGNPCAQHDEIDLTMSSAERIARLDDYLTKSSRHLDELTERVVRGNAVGRDSHDWILGQVDFLVETMSNDNLELDDEIRSKLLHLLLACANLNEHIRHQASLSA